MSAEGPIEKDAMLDQALGALRDAPMPEGPSDQVRRATLAAMREADSRTVLRFPFHVFQGAWRIAAAVAIVVVGSTVLFSWSYRHPSKNIEISRGSNTGSHPEIGLNPKGAGNDGAPTVAISDPFAVVGAIRFDGPAPPRRQIDFSKVITCSTYHTKPAFEDSLLVNNNGTLKNVVVSVVAGLPSNHEFQPPSSPIILNQEDCFFSPHVVAMVTGQQVSVRNSDPFLHNVRSTASENERFNFAQYTRNDTTKIRSPSVPEFFQVKCDVHPWMNSWICVFDHPYFAVTTDSGDFNLRGLPPGRYTVRAWHEKLGSQEREIIVEAGKPTSVDFTFRAAETVDARPTFSAPIVRSRSNITAPTCLHCDRSTASKLVSVSLGDSAGLIIPSQSYPAWAAAIRAFVR